MMLIETTNQTQLHIDRQAQLENSKEYISSFLSSIKHLDAYQYNNCPTCGSSSCNPIFTKNGGQYSYCQSCDHIFLSKSLKHQYLIDFYTNYPTSSLDWHKNESEFYNRIYNSGLDIIKSSIADGLLLDIGCSSGCFLSIASKNGFSTYGIEPNARESSYALDNGINIIGQTISDLSLSSKFDIITMWDVLEHIDSPADYISNLKTYLNPGGLVFVQVPTSDSLAARIMREKSNMFDGIEHLTLFSQKSLDLCFISSGFRPLYSKTVISDSYALKNYLSYESDPYLPDSHHSDSFCSELIDFASIESSCAGYKIQSCYIVQS